MFNKDLSPVRVASGPKRTAKILIFPGNSNNLLKISGYLSGRSLPRAGVVLPPRVRVAFLRGPRVLFLPVLWSPLSRVCGWPFSNYLKINQLQSALPQTLQKSSTPAVRHFVTPCKPITSTHRPRRPPRATDAFIDGPRRSSPLGDPAAPLLPGCSPILRSPAPPRGAGRVGPWSWRRCRAFLAQVCDLLGAGVISQGYLSFAEKS